MTKVWSLFSQDIEQRQNLAAELNVSKLVAQVLINRAITQTTCAGFFLEPSFERLHDPFLMKDMQKVVDRIHLAQKNQESVLVFGDYDVDGVTSSTLLTQLLKCFGLTVFSHIPHRMTDGYGLNKEVVDFAQKNDISLILTVDCGITAVSEVEFIQNNGIDVLIIDHHEPEGDVPDAHAIVDPKQPDCDYPFKGLAAVGLVAKLAQAMYGKIPKDFLDLTAIGTVADMAPLVNENRILVREGLKRVSQTKNKGLRALLDLSKVSAAKLTPYHIGFVLGPRINAAGRMDSAQTALDLFLTQDSHQAYMLAEVLNNFNLDRQKMQRSIIEEAVNLIEENEEIKNQKVIVLGKKGWHKGVVGIVASQIKERYSRPAVVIAINDEGIGTASARSINGFHMQEAFMNCSDSLEAYGGHAGAAGMTIKQENIEGFIDQINSVAHENMTDEDLTPTLMIDAELPLAAVTVKVANDLEALAPFGEGNPMPIFSTLGVTVKGNSVVLGKNTLKFWVTDGSTMISVVGFGKGELKKKLKNGSQIDIAYQVGIDDWNKDPVPQIILKDIRIHS